MKRRTPFVSQEFLTFQETRVDRFPGLSCNLRNAHQPFSRESVSHERGCRGMYPVQGLYLKPHRGTSSKERVLTITKRFGRFLSFHC